MSPLFTKYGWKKPSMAPYLLTYTAGVLAGVCELSPRPINTTNNNNIDPVSDEGKKTFLAVYTIGLLKTGLAADKAQQASTRMATALGLVKGGVAISGANTWLGRSLPPAGNERDNLVAAMDGFVTIA